jgi:hypothetical protein
MCLQFGIKEGILS